MIGASRFVRSCVMALLAITSAATLRAQEREREAPREDIDAREEWFWAQRSFPSSIRPYAAMLNARLAAFAELWPAAQPFPETRHSPAAGVRSGRKDSSVRTTATSPRARRSMRGA
jgi:hypothetical protein